jgi:hypothetical protein
MAQLVVKKVHFDAPGVLPMEITRRPKVSVAIAFPSCNFFLLTGEFLTRGSLIIDVS